MPAIIYINGTPRRCFGTTECAYGRKCREDCPRMSEELPACDPHDPCPEGEGINDCERRDGKGKS